MDLAGEPWGGLLWDGTNHRMVTAAPNQRVAGWVMFHAVGGDLGSGGTVLGRKGTTTERLRGAERTLICGMEHLGATVNRRRFVERRCDQCEAASAGRDRCVYLDE